MATNLMENPLILYSSPGTLQELAVSNIALLCWRHEVGNLNSVENIEAYKVYIHDYALPLPRHMIDLINRLIQPFGYKFMKWWHFHGILHLDLGGLSVVHDSFRIECLNSLILKPDVLADICYIKTARYLLTSDELTLFQKYRLACMYRFKDYIEKLWPWVMNSGGIHPQYFINSPLQNAESSRILTFKYWNYNSKYKIETLEIPLSNIFGTNLNMCVSCSIVQMLRSSNMHPKMKAEYICNFLQSIQSSERIGEIIIRNLFPRETILFHSSPVDNDLRYKLEQYEVVKYLLPKLKTDDLDRILKNFLFEIIFQLAREEENYNYILQIWTYAKDIVVESKLDKILCGLWRMAFSSDYCPFTRHVANLLCDLFISMSDKVKNFVVGIGVERFFDGLPLYHEEDNMNMAECYDSNVDFFLQLLNCIEFEQRRELWVRNWYKLIFLTGTSNLDKFMKLCYEAEEIQQCKEDIRQICSTSDPCIYNVFIKNGFCFELVNLLKFLIPSDDKVKEEIVQIVHWNMDNMPMMNSNALVRFIELIDGLYDSVDEAKQCKEEYIVKSVELWWYWVNDGYFTGVMNTIDCLMFFEQTAGIIELKKIFYGYYQNALRAGNFVDFSEEFLHWCAPSQEELDELKKSLDIADIFQKFVTELRSWAIENDGQQSPNNHQKYKKFLQWYFGDENARKDFAKMMLEKIDENDRFGFRSLFSRVYYKFLV